MQKIIKYCLYVILLLLLFFTPFTYFPWNFGKTVIFQILIEILAFFSLILLLSGDKKNWKDLFKKRDWLDLSVLFFLLIFTVTSLTGVDISNSFWGNISRANGVFTWWHFGVWYFLLRAYLKTQKDWNLFFIVNTAVAFLVALSSFFSFLLPKILQSDAGGGIIGNRAFLAAYLLLSIGMAVYLALNFKKIWRWIFIAAAVIFAVAIYQTGIRGVFLGLVAGIIITLLFVSFFNESKKVKKITGGILIAFILLSGATFLVLQKTAVGNYFNELKRITNITTESVTSQTRLMAWQIAWQGIKDKPLLGWGPDNYAVIFDKYYNPEFLKYTFAETVWDKPHNWLLEIGVDSGILGMLSYLGIIFSAAFFLFKIGKKNTWPAAIFLGALGGYFVQDLFLFEITSQLILWFVLLAFVGFLHQQQTESIQEESPVLKIKFDWQSGGLSLILFLFLIFSLYKFNYLPLKASYYLQKAMGEDAVVWAKNVDAALTVSTPVTKESAIFLAQHLTDLDRAGAIGNYSILEKPALETARFLENAGQHNPLYLKYPTWAGQIYLILGERIDQKYYTEAEKNILKAKDISPRKQETLLLLGRLYLLEKNFAQAIVVDKEAVNVDPEISTSHWFLALAYGAVGDAKNSIAEIEYIQDKLGVKLTSDQNLYLIDMYAADKQYAKIVSAYQKLVEQEPNNLNWYIKLASAYALNGEKQKALDVIDYILRIDPSLKTEAEKFIKANNLK